MSMPPIVGLGCRRYRDGAFSEIVDEVAVETGIEVTCGPGPVSRLYAAPFDLETLALGHACLEMCPPGFRPIPLAGDDLTEAGRRDDHRRFAFDMIAKDTARPGPKRHVFLAPGNVVESMRRFIAAPGLWNDTGCFHRACALDPVTGDFSFRAEDIGRHNCLDRLRGLAMRAEQDLDGLILFLSARVTASMCEKALRAGFTCIVSRSAVTTEAVRLAQEGGISLAGFAREAENRFTVFCDPQARFAT
ncbi:MAG: fatty-acid--CoA ligase [Desulfovibrio sp.]|nr:fatty-acid--CoA ligase [Desulfovibrio sp.]